MEHEARASRRFGAQATVALCFAALVTVISWVFVSSPEAYSRTAAEFFNAVQTPAALVAMIMSVMIGNVHGGAAGEGIYWALVFMEWSVVGFELAVIYTLARSALSRRTT